MPKRRSDADSRRFLDEFECVRPSRFRAMGTIDPLKREALIPWPSGKVKLIGVQHTKLRHGGGWSFFVCPRCKRRAGKLWDVNDQPLCVKCCAIHNIRHRTQYGFGRHERTQASDKLLDELIAKLETNEPLRLKPAPVSWGSTASRVYNSRRLTQCMRRRMVSLRLGQLASQQTRDNHGGLKITRAYQPSPKALAAIPELAPVWRARTHESLAKALDKAQTAVIQALNSPDPKVRVIAARLMLNSKQGRERGFAIAAS